MPTDRNVLEFLLSIAPRLFIREHGSRPATRRSAAEGSESKSQVERSSEFPSRAPCAPPGIAGVRRTTSSLDSLTGKRSANDSGTVLRAAMPSTIFERASPVHGYATRTASTYGNEGVSWIDGRPKYWLAKKGLYTRCGDRGRRGQ